MRGRQYVHGINTFHFVITILILLTSIGNTEIIGISNKEAITGIWICGASYSELSIYFHGESIIVECYDTDSDEHFRVSDVHWDGQVLEVTLCYLSTGYTSYWTFTPVNSDTLESTYESFYSGTQIWTRR